MLSKTGMSEPTQEYLRRGQVIDWLEGEGITRWATQKMMQEGLLVGVRLHSQPNGKAANNGSHRKGKPKHCGGKPGPRMYYQKSQIKEKLKL